MTSVAGCFQRFGNYAPSVSIIVPVYNEERALPGLFTQLYPLRDAAEIIFVDGGSVDATRSLVADAGFGLVEASRGRGSQLNAGARVATGDVLFFVHADSILPSDPLGEIRRALRRRRVGCFGLKFRPSSALLRICQALSNYRCFVRRIMFGDQGIFIERELFFEIGGFPELPLMEDYQLSLNLRARGERPGATRHRIITSSRRYGTTAASELRTMALMIRLRRLYRRGVPPDELARLYGEAR